MPTENDTKSPTYQKGSGPFFGSEALKICGMQDEFATHVLLLCGDSKTSFSFRAGNPPSYDAPRSAKSSENKSKTSNHGFASTLLSADPNFNKLDNKRNPIPHDDKDADNLKKGEQQIVQISYTLKEIIEKCSKDNNSDLQILGYDPTSKNLTIGYLPGKEPKDYTGVFTVNLDQGVKIDRKITRSSISVAPGIQKPVELKDLSSAEFQQLLNLDFKIFYSKSKSSLQEKFMVFSRDNKPITGDWDVLMMGHPHELDQKYSKSLNTLLKEKDKETNMTERDTLFKLTVELWEENKTRVVNLVKAGFPVKKLLVRDRLFYDKEFLEIFKETSLKQAGCITTYEFMQTSIVNYSYAEPNNAVYGNNTTALKDKDTNINYLIQHGPENRNPSKPSDLDGRILHVTPWGSRGSFVLTTTQKQSVDLFAEEEYLEHNSIEVNPKWDMSLWGKVIESQIKLGHFIYPDTFDAYNKYQSLLAIDHKYQPTSTNYKLELSQEDLKLVQNQLASNQKLPPHIHKLYYQPITSQHIKHRSSLMEIPKEIRYMSRQLPSIASKEPIENKVPDPDSPPSFRPNN